MKKLLSVSALVLGMFIVSSFGQETNPTEKPKNNNENQGQKQKRNGGNRGEKGKNKLMQMDTNNDGFISQSEWTRNEKAFKKIDTNNDGQLSKEELQAARQQRDQNSNKPKPNPQI